VQSKAIGRFVSKRAPVELLDASSVVRCVSFDFRQTSISIY
jgi:hypothetical protein